MKKERQPSFSGKIRFIDIIVLIVFISTAFLGIYLFRQDLMQTIEERDMEPAGIIIIRNNVVQRRHADRVLWDRLFVDSPVYPGDLVRAADLSSTFIDIEKNEIFLNENTLIRIQHSMSGMGSFLVELQEGSLSVTSSPESSGIMLDLMGSYVQAVSGTVLNASAGEEGISVQVNEGRAEFIQEGQSREISEGAMIAFDTQGVERIIPAAVVLRPAPNARYLKSSSDLLQVGFFWNRINIEEGETLRLETASDLNFTNNYRVINGLTDSVQAAFDVGRWHWRLSYEDVVLNRGQFVIVDSSGPALLSPVPGSIFRYNEIQPRLRFQWAEREGASGYLIEINDTPDFSAPRITRQTTASSLILSELGEGVWYWRVKPVFILIFEGEALYSPAVSFRIERVAEPAIEIPPAAVAQARASSPAVRAVQPAVRPVPAVTMPRSGQLALLAHYTVQPGDTLGRIAILYYGDPLQWSRISEANNIINPYLIFPGQVFLIP
jgi:hypothetical protein